MQDGSDISKDVMYYPQEVVEQVVAANDIVDVIGSYVQLKRAGSSYKGLCPFHSEKTPSFSVSPSRQTFHCFGCGEGGGVITFVMKYENDSFQEALQVLADRAGIKLPEADYSERAKEKSAQRARLLAVNKEAATYYYRLLRSPKGRTGFSYLSGRGLSAQTMKNFGLGYADGSSSDLLAYLKEKGCSEEDVLAAGVAVFDEKRGLRDKFWNRVMFPIMDPSNRVIGFGGRVMGEGKPKYLNSPETPVFDKSRNLYGLNIAKRSRTGSFILCEGYMDVIAMHQAGFTQAVASLGTSFTEGQAMVLRRYTKEVLLAYDSDSAGVNAAIRNIGILDGAGLTGRVVNLEPYKDPDEFVRNLGAEELQKRLDNAENSFFFRIRQISGKYTMQDPASRTAFYQELARQLCAFENEIERDSYIKAMSEQYFIDEGMLRRQVEQYRKYYSADGNRDEAPGSRRPAQYSSGSAAVMHRISPEDRQLSAKGKAAEPGTSSDHSPGADTKRTKTDEKKDQNTVYSAFSPAESPWAKNATQRDERLLLTWISEDPQLYPQIRSLITADDFAEGIGREAAKRYFVLLDREAGDPLSVASGSGGRVSASPSLVIASFEEEGEQEAVSELFETRLEGIAPNERQKALRDILCNVKNAHIRRLSADMKDTSSLEELVRQKRFLATIRSMELHLKETEGEESWD